MSTGVGRVCFWVGVWVLGYDQRVQFSQHSQCWARATARRLSLHTGYAQAALGLHTQFGELLGNQVGGLKLAEPRLRVLQNRFGQSDEFIGPGVDYLRGFVFQVLFRGH